MSTEEKELNITCNLQDNKKIKRAAQAIVSSTKQTRLRRLFTKTINSEIFLQICRRMIAIHSTAVVQGASRLLLSHSLLTQFHLINTNCHRFGRL